MKLLGDFSFSDINWKNLSSSNHYSNLFCDFVYDHFPTHIKENILDLVFAKSADLVYVVCVLYNEPYLKLVSDHKLICFTILCKLSEHPVTRLLQFIFSKVIMKV